MKAFKWLDNRGLLLWRNSRKLNMFDTELAEPLWLSWLIKPSWARPAGRNGKMAKVCEFIVEYLKNDDNVWSSEVCPVSLFSLLSLGYGLHWQLSYILYHNYSELQSGFTLKYILNVWKMLKFCVQRSQNNKGQHKTESWCSACISSFREVEYLFHSLSMFFKWLG